MEVLFLGESYQSDCFILQCISPLWRLMKVVQLLHKVLLDVLCVQLQDNVLLDALYVQLLHNVLLNALREQPLHKVLLDAPVMQLCIEQGCS